MRHQSFSAAINQCSQKKKKKREEKKVAETEAIIGIGGPLPFLVSKMLLAPAVRDTGPREAARTISFLGLKRSPPLLSSASVLSEAAAAAVPLYI